MRRILIVLGLLVAVTASSGFAQSRVEKNVVYGRYSGLALLMDVYRPPKPNGYGVIFVAGSGWYASPEYNAVPLSETQISVWGPPLLEAGYTVFSINHRAAPAFPYPAAVDDVARAVRFVRHNGKRFGINPQRIGGVGGSSGAHLLALVATRAEGGVANDPDPVNREAATLQALALRAGRYDFRTEPIGDTVALFMGVLPREPSSKALYAEASPLTHVTRSAPPTLLLHGDSDDAVPHGQSVAMEKALGAAGVPVTLVTVPGGEHGPAFGSPGKPYPGVKELFAQTTAWLDKYLKTE